MAKFIYKPSSQGSANPGGTSVLFEDTGITGAAIYDGQGKKIEDLQRGATEGNVIKYQSRKPGSSYGNDFVIKYTNADGTEGEYNIANGGQRYEGEIGNPDSLAAVNKGPSGSGGNFDPQQYGDYGIYPGYLGGQFPNPYLANYQNIQSAPYDFVDPMDFASQYGEFNTEKIRKNFDTAKDMALNQLDTELQGLRSFVPTASALKRQQLSLDNIFNTEQRKRQVQSALPGAREALAGQTARAESYARGEVPNEIVDKALELGVRSNAADIAGASGIGATSIAAGKLSNQMSADRRIELSAYGDQLLTGSINSRANLLLPPTAYSDAGSQIRVMPEVGAGQLQGQNAATLNNYNALPVSQAYQSVIGQNQFATNLEQGTRQFNASNNLNTSLANAGIQNTSAATKFQYDTGYAAAVAGAAQNNLNTNFQLQQQQMFQDIFSQYQGDAQDSQNAGAGGELAGGLGAVLFDKIKDLLGLGGTSDGQEKGSATNPGSGSDGNLGDVLQGIYDSIFGSDVQPANLPSVPSDTNISSPDLNPTYADTVSFPETSAARVAQANSTANSILNTAGISSTPAAGYQSIGVNDNGEPVYADSALLNSSDMSLGASYARSMQQILSPFGVLDESDKNTFGRIATLSSDPDFMRTLDYHVQNKNPEEFMRELTAAFQNLREA